MAKKQLTISIPTPCTEDWNAMTPNQSGKFCASCQKTVVDFSRMSDAEIFNYFDNFSGNTCGRFTEKQLATPFSAPMIGKPQNRWAWALSALLLPSVLASQTLKRTEIMKIIPPSVFEQKTGENSLPIKGEVTELGTNVPLVNVYISIVANEKLIGRASTDDKGIFMIQLPQEFENQKFTLFFDCNKMEKQVLNFSNYAEISNSQLFVYMQETEEEKTTIRLRGVVMDEHNEVLIGASIMIKGTTNSAVTDLDGRFELKVPLKEVNYKSFEIVANFVGYELKEVPITPSSLDNENLVIRLPEGAVLGGYMSMIVHYNFFQRTKFKIRNFFRRLRNN
jgi:CarboxypepD_reg-like domain